MKELFKKIWIYGLFLLCVGCAGTKKIQYVPTQTEYRVEYRDSIIHIRDSIRVEVPKEVIREILPILDTSRLQTKVAQSIAYVDTLNRKLIHKLENKPSFNTKIDTIVKVVYKTEYLEKPIITEVEVPKPYIPKIFWVLLIYAVGTIILFILKLNRF